jgi:predicted  nucleic acid-binding Zn-ribbon protein
MATASEVKAGLDDIATSIRNSRQALAQSKARIQSARNELANIPTTFADIIAEIDGYSGADAFEQLAQAEKAKLAAEFTALRDEMDALINSTEF